MIIDGKRIRDEILEELRQKIVKNNLQLCLSAVLVGDDPGLKKFVDLKTKAAESIGISFNLFEFTEEISTERLRMEVAKIVADDKNSGIFVELPLPKTIDTNKILGEIRIEKDVDILSPGAQNKFFSGSAGGLMPPAVEAVKIVLEKYGVSPENKKVAIFGQGLLIGKPIAHWLSRNGAEVYRIDEFTENPESYSTQADIIISGVGKPNLIKGDMVKDGAVVIDFGYGKEKDKMAGDVDFESVAPKAGLITPVPGGMGPVVIAAVLKNLIELNS